MTLISSFKRLGDYFFISDIFVASPLHYDYSPPSVRKVNINPSIGQSYAGPIQKTAIINDNWLVMVAGSLTAGSRFIQDISRIIKKCSNFTDQLNEIDIYVLNTPFYTIGFQEIARPNFIIFGFDLNKKTIHRKCLHDKEHEIQSQLFENLLCYGTGFKDLKFLVTNMNEKTVKFETSEISPKSMGIYWAIELVENLYCQDFLPQPESFNHLYGGLFEITILTQYGFKKVGDYKILIWNSVDDELYLRQMMHITYEKEFLYVDVIEFDLVEELPKDLRVKSLRNERIQIFPICSSLTENPTIDLPFIFNLIYIGTEDTIEKVGYLNLFNPELFSRLDVNKGIRLDFFQYFFDLWDKVKKDI